MVAAARTAMVDGMLKWANPSSPHAEGRAARAALEDARARIAAALDWPYELIFTSGASEAINIAFESGLHYTALVGATEHDAVHRAGNNAYFLSVGGDGLVAKEALTGRLGALGARLPLVAIQSANNETGVLQPLHELSQIIHDAGGLLFADCSQSAGKLPLPLGADLIAISAHKLGGPPGIGALLLRSFDLLRATGGQERGYRGGTENLPAALGFAAAVESNRGWVERAKDLRAHLDGAVEAAGGEIIAKSSPRIATIASYRMPGMASATQLIQFDMAGIAVSAGSACSSGTIKGSPVLAAMGYGEPASGEIVRVSFGADTSRADIYRFIDAWKRIRQ